MRKFPAVLLAATLTGLLTVTGFVVDGATTARPPGTTSVNPSTGAHLETASTESEPEAEAVAQPVKASADPTSPPTASTRPAPSGSGCDPAVVHDTIAGSDAVADGLAFEIPYLKCAEGYGWAVIYTPEDEAATVLIEGSGADISLLDLGSSVCALDSGMPATVAVQLAPPGSHWLDECG
jgi:hypothetical protein